MNIGDKRVDKRWHSDGGCWCYAAQELAVADGKYAKEGATYWKDLTLEPFYYEQDAINHIGAA